MATSSVTPTRQIKTRARKRIILRDVRQSQGAHNHAHDHATATDGTQDGAPHCPLHLHGHKGPDPQGPPSLTAQISLRRLGLPSHLVGDPPLLPFRDPHGLGAPLHTQPETAPRTWPICAYLAKGKARQVHLGQDSARILLDSSIRSRQPCRQAASNHVTQRSHPSVYLTLDSNQTAERAPSLGRCPLTCPGCPLGATGPLVEVRSRQPQSLAIPRLSAKKGGGEL